MTVFDWPTAVFGAEGVAFDQRGMTVAGPPSLMGQSQIGQIDAGYWIANISLQTLGRGDRVRTFRALRALLEGGAHQLRVPVFDDGQTPWPAAGEAAANELDPLTHSDGTTFSDGSGYHQGAISVVLASDASLRDTAIDVTVLRSGTIHGGEYFSIGDRLHLIRQILSVAGSAQGWSIWPPLREDATAGRGLNFDRPVCRMTLTAESATDLALGRLWQGRPQIGFIESLQ